MKNVKMKIVTTYNKILRKVVREIETRKGHCSTGHCS
jgi:hypothetical protein